MIKKSTKKFNEHLSFFMCLSPWILGFLLFTLIPMALSIYYSFYKIHVYNMSVVKPQFIGFENFKTAFNDDLFLKSISNTFKYAIIRIPLGIIVSLLFACLLNKEIKCRKLFRTMVYLPAILPVIGSVIVWKQLFSNDFSLLNYLLGFIGIKPIDWLNYDNAMGSIIFMSIWNGIGPSMIIFIAALQGISEDVMEAAELDGANSIIKFFTITLAFISPTIFYLLITGIISALQAYAEMYLLSVQGDSTITMTMLVVRNMYKFDGPGIGYASALSWIIFVIIFIFSILFFTLSSKFVYYGGDE